MLKASWKQEAFLYLHKKPFIVSLRKFIKQII